MLLEGNIEYFTFLFLRQSGYFVSKDFSYKLHIIFTVLFYFVIFLYAIGFYFMSKYFMGKLSKYFLDNIFRINGCFLLMTLIYGVRPLSRGIIHALMYYDPDKQLLLLSIVDGLLMLIIIDYSISISFDCNLFYSV